MDARAHEGTALFRACIEGQGDARERFVEVFGEIVRSAIVAVLERRGRLTQRELVDEITQDVFAALFSEDCRKLRQFHGKNGCSPTTWLRVVSTRMTIDALRRERTAALPIEHEHSETPDRPAGETSGAGPEDMVILNETLGRVRQAIRTLRPRDQLLLRLHLVEGMPIGETARLLHISRSLAYVRKNRLLRRLQRLLGDAPQGGVP